MRKIFLFFLTILALVIGQGVTATADVAATAFSTAPKVAIDVSHVGTDQLFGISYVGRWAPTPETFSYQWILGGSRPICGSSDSPGCGATYQLPADSAGQTLQVEVTANHSLSGSKILTSAAITIKPIISESAPGLDASTGSWATSGPVSVGTPVWTISSVKAVFQWYLDGVAIKLQTRASVAVKPEWEGRTLSCKVTATRTGYYPKVVQVARVIQMGNLDSNPLPAIVGAASVDATLTATTNGWAQSGMTHAYEWLRDGTSIPGAVARTYVPTADDLGAMLTVRVHSSRAHFSDRTIVSPAVGPVVPAVLRAKTVPVISGSLGIGKALYATTGSVLPAAHAYEYQWLRNGVSIPDATGRRYVLTLDDAEYRIAVRITYTHADSVPVSQLSAAKNNWQTRSFSKTISGANICAVSENTGGTYSPCSTSIFNGSAGQMYSDFDGNMGFRSSIAVTGRVTTWKIRFNGIWKDNGTVFRYSATNSVGSRAAATSWAPQGNFGYIWSPYRSWATGSSNLQSGGRVYFSVTSSAIWSSLYFNSVTIWYTSWI